jgi:hypothetical protein
MSIILEPVTSGNGWSLIYYNNMLGVYKDNYYYYLDNPYHFKGRPIYYNVAGLNYLGVYKPVIADNSYLRSIPVVINNNNFIVNTLTKIVYIKPTGLLIMIPGSIPYNYELYSTYTFAGVYSPYMNSNGTSGKLFISMMPNTTNKPQRIESDQTKYTSPIENTLTQNPYPPEYTKKDTTHIEGNINNVNIITFIIPFVYINDLDTLEKTINSIKRHVSNNRIILVTRYNIPDSIKQGVMILPYTRYVGRLGYENKLNVSMDNGYDIESFYNYLISNYVKTYMFTIWNYNWEIQNWPTSIATSRTFIVPNYYTNKDNIYKSIRWCKTGYILFNNKTRYNNTGDMFDVFINGLGPKDMDMDIVIRGNYSEKYNIENLGLLLYGNELEVRDFYYNISKGIIPDYVEKII